MLIFVPIQLSHEGVVEEKRHLQSALGRMRTEMENLREKSASHDHIQVLPSKQQLCF